jgi:DNA-binding transcriptional LysR family regulator
LKEIAEISWAAIRLRMNALTDWTLVRSFLEVLRRGSLSAAARATGLTQPTIGRHIDQFEDAIGIGLFTRSSGGLIATEAALALRPHAEAMEASMAALVRTASMSGDKTAPRGTVRITASEIMGATVLPAVLANIRFAYPDLVFELTLNNRSDDLLRRDADIAMRMVRPTQDGLVAKKIGDVPLRLYGHRRYLDRFGMPDSLDALTRQHLIGFDRDDFSARSVAAGTLPISRDLFSVRCDNDLAQLAAIEAGLGIGVMQVALAKRNPELVAVMPDQVKLKLELWLAVHEDQREQPAIRAVFDGLAEGLAEFASDR